MKFVHYPLNPEGQGLHRIAEVYVADRFDIHAKATPSSSLRSLIYSKEVPEDLRRIFTDLLVAGNGR